MLPSSGYFKNISCPYFKSGFCCRPHCHYNHVKPITYIPTPVLKPTIEYRPTPIHELKKLRPLSADETGNKLTQNNNTEIIKQDGTYDMNEEKSEKIEEKRSDKSESIEKNDNSKKRLKETESKKKMKISKKVKSKRFNKESKDKKRNEKKPENSETNKELDKKKAGTKNAKKKKGTKTKKLGKINKSDTFKEENKVDNVDKDKPLTFKDESDNSKISSNVETKKDSILRLDEEWAKVLETPENDFKPSKKPRVAHKPSEKSTILVKKPEKLTPAQVMYNRFLIAEKNNTEYKDNPEKKRIAHSSNIPEPIKNEPPKKRPIIPSEFGTKVPMIIRQRYLNTFIDELLEFMNEEEAFVRALTEEKIVYTRCTTKNVYLNLAVNVVKKIRGECRLKKDDTKQIKNKDKEIIDKEMVSIGNKKVSHEKILNGPHAKNCSIEKKRTLTKVNIGKQEN